MYIFSLVSIMKWVEQKLTNKCVYVTLILTFISGMLFGFYYKPKSKKDKVYGDIISYSINLVGFSLLLFYMFLIKFREGFCVVGLAVLTCIFILANLVAKL